jgi:glycerophosphoryl diester phosphodiesterase
MTSSVQRIAHRGGSRLAPENTLAAFRNALTLPVDTIELDVQMSRDGYSIVFHDNTLERLTDGNGNILDLDFAYLRSLNAAAHFPGWPVAEQIPTLREVLDLANGRVQVQIEIKTSQRDGVYGRYPQIAEAVVNEVRATGMLQQVVIISFDWPVLPVVKALEPALVTGAIVSDNAWKPDAEDALDTLVQQIKPLGCEWIALDHKLFTSDMPAVLHKHGFQSGLWTVNTLEQLRHFATAGVDALTSDRPDFFAQL